MARQSRGQRRDGRRKRRGRGVRGEAVRRAEFHHQPIGRGVQQRRQGHIRVRPARGGQAEVIHDHRLDLRHQRGQKGGETLTLEVHLDVPDADTFYPAWDATAWRETAREEHDWFTWRWLERIVEDAG